MVDDVSVKPERRIAIADEWWTLRDSEAPAVFSDYITEARHWHGNVYLSFGSGVIDANNEPVIDIVSRLRMNLGTAQVLHQLLGQMIDDALKPVDKSTAN